MAHPEHRESSHGRLKGALVVGVMAALLLSQDRDDLQERRERVEAAQETILNRAVKVRQDIARQFGSCSINSFLHVYSSFRFGQINYVEVDHTAQETVRRRPAKVIPRDQVKLSMTLNVREPALRAREIITYPKIYVNEVVPRAHRVRMTEDGQYRYAEPVPIEATYDRRGTQAVVSVDVYPPTSEQVDAPIAIGISTTAEFSARDEIHGVHRPVSIGTVLCGYMTKEDGLWQLMPANGMGTPDMRPTTFVDASS